MVQDPLKVKFFEKAQIVSEKLNKLVKENGDLKVDEINLGQLVGGMRSVKSMLWETSELDPELGIKFRGYDIFQLRELLPKVPNGTEPLPEALFWLMLVDEIPTQEEAQWLTDQWMRRSVIPDHVFKVLDSLPKNTHPMSQFSIAITAMQNQSIFARRHGEGMNKNEYWNATYEDTMNLLDGATSFQTRSKQWRSAQKVACLSEIYRYEQLRQWIESGVKNQRASSALRDVKEGMSKSKSFGVKELMSELFSN